MSFRIASVLSVTCIVMLSGCEDAKLLELDGIEADVSDMVAAATETRQSVSPNVTSIVSAGYTSALAQAVARHPGVAAAKSRVVEAESAIRIAASAARPQTQVSATAGGISEGGDDEAGVAADMSITQMIYDGGATSAKISEAQATAYAAHADLERIQNEVARDAALSWIDLWHANAQIALIATQNAEVEKLLGQIERLIESGMVDKTSVVSARSSLLEMRLETERYNATRRESQERFRRYFGGRVANVPKPTLVFSASEIPTIADAWDESPVLTSSAAMILATQRSIEAQEATRKPTLDLHLGANSPMSSTDEEEATVGFVVRHLLTDGGRREAEFDRLVAKLEGEKSAFEDTRTQLSVEAQAMKQQYKSMSQSVRLLDQQIKEISEERDLLRSQIASGQASLRQLVDIETQIYQSRSRLIDLHREVYTTEMLLSAATGHLADKLGVGF